MYLNHLRFLNQSQYEELVNLYHLARVPLGGGCSKYDRMIWATKEFHKKYPSISATAAYKDLETNLNQT